MKKTTTTKPATKIAAKTSAAKTSAAKTSAAKSGSGSGKSNSKMNKATKSEAEILEGMIREVSKETKPAVKTRKTAKSKSTKRKPAEDSLALAQQIAQGMFEKKAEQITILDMRNVKGASADFFVLSHAESDKQVEAIANSVEEEVAKASDEWPRHREGFTNLEWVLLDYFDVVAHVFQREKREFYAVEELWGDAIEIPFEGK